MKTERKIKDGKMWGTISDTSLFNAYFVNLQCELTTVLEISQIWFFLKKLVDTCPFRGTADTPVLTSGDMSSGFQSQSGQAYSHLAEAYTMYVP